MTVLEVAGATLMVLSYITPFIAFNAMLRRPDRRRLHVVAATSLAAAAPVSIAGVIYSVVAGDWSAGMPWILIALAYGMAVGVLGLLARSFGRWLSDREP